MSDYTPTTEEVRDAFSDYKEDDAGDWGKAEAQFYRWLAEVKAEAWEEGCRWGAVEFQTLDGKLYDEDKVQVTDADNPYRQEESSGNSSSQPKAETPNYLNWQEETE